MSNQRDRDIIAAALLEKGFKVKSTHHQIYFLYFKDKKTSIFTKISHGSKYKTYSDSLLGLMSRQLRLKKSELLKLIDCSINYQNYIKILIERGHLK